MRLQPVSYTHLDVYKRQVAIISPALGMLLLNYILEGVFERYMSDEDREAENERNQEFYN